MTFDSRSGQKKIPGNDVTHDVTSILQLGQFSRGQLWGATDEMADYLDAFISKNSFERGLPPKLIETSMSNKSDAVSL